MKRILALIAAMAIGLTACAGNIGTTTTASIEITGEIGGEITVYTFDSMLTGPFLEEAAQMFMHQNPGTVVHVEAFSSMPEIRRSEGADGTAMMIATQGDTAQERRDYINMVNTELMSGRGPDILAFDVLPFHEYARNGQLVNLRDFMDADPNFDINDYRVNIFDALTTAQGQFMFPVDYAFQYIAYDSSLFSDAQLAQLEAGGTFSFDRMIEIGQMDHIEEHLFGMNADPRPGLFQGIFAQNYSQFIDIENRQANFTDGAFEALLNQLIDLEAGGYIPPRADAPESVAMRTDIMQQMLSERFAFKPRPSAMLLTEFQRRDGREGAMMMVSVGGAMGNPEDDEIAGIMGNDQGQVPFTVNQGFGINTNSQNQETAWEFIKFLSSDAVRHSMRMAGLPTHIEAFEERAELSLTGALFAGEFAGRATGGAVFRSGDGEGESDDADTDAGPVRIVQGQGDQGGQMTMMAPREMDEADHVLLAEYIAMVEHFTSQLNAFFVTDAIIEDIVLTEVREFFDGSRSAEDVAQTLQSRINLFLNE
ncbi:MAG: extracellular solute-binding protein [Defluviitaleaceae bacterium]|nr:extracellular solute-binding protein [Defluviitaleaceae bacterium]